MTDNERRYSEDEVREIFQLATDKQQDAASQTSSSGLTLSEIQDIGREVGLEPAALERAAATFAVRAPTAALKRSFGMPLEVGRVVPLSRAPTDEEWGIIVGELRSTFRARGKVSSQPGIREWSNGNLHACIEPSETGYRLRLGTLKSNAIAMNAVGVTGLVTAAIVAGTGLITTSFDVVFTAGIFAAAGGSALLSNVLRLPRWAERRDEQMEYIAAKVTSLIQSREP